MKNHDVRIINGLELCMYTSKNHADSKMLHLEGDNNNMSNSPVENYNGSIVIKVLFFILKVILSVRHHFYVLQRVPKLINFSSVFVLSIY